MQRIGPVERPATDFASVDRVVPAEIAEVEARLELNVPIPLIHERRLPTPAAASSLGLLRDQRVSESRPILGGTPSQGAESASGSWRWRSSSTGDSAAPSVPDIRPSSSADRSSRRSPK